MNSKLSLFAIGVLVAMMAMIAPMDTAVAQDSEASADGEEYKDGEHKGKSCPFKEKKEASVESPPSA